MEKSVTFSDATSENGHRGPANMDEELGQSSSRDHEGVDEKALSYSTSSGRCTDLHILSSYTTGQSKVEKLARKIQERLDERVMVTPRSRIKFLKHCREIATRKGYAKKYSVKYSDILEYRREVKDTAEDKNAKVIITRFGHWLGILCDVQSLSEILEKAEQVGSKIGLETDDDFHYQDFNCELRQAYD